MFKFIERFLTRIVANAITPELLVRSVRRDALVEALNSNGMRSLIVEEMVEAMSLKDLAMCFDLTAIEEELASRVSPREIARYVDHNDIIESLDISTDDIVELTVDRLAGDTCIYSEDVVGEAARRWVRDNKVTPESLAADIIRIAYKNL